MAGLQHKPRHALPVVDLQSRDFDNLVCTVHMLQRQLNSFRGFTGKYVINSITMNRSTKVVDFVTQGRRNQNRYCGYVSKAREKRRPHQYPRCDCCREALHGYMRNDVSMALGCVAPITTRRRATINKVPTYRSHTNVQIEDTTWSPLAQESSP